MTDLLQYLLQSPFWGLMSMFLVVAFALFGESIYSIRRDKRTRKHRHS